MSLNLNQKIYVAGHRGMVGSAIVRNLQAKGFTNIVTRTHSELDLVNQNKVFDFLAHEKPDYIFLAAGRVGGIKANQEYGAEFIYQNLMIEANIINGAHLADVQRLCFFSSASIYPKNCVQPMKESYLFTGKFEESNKPYSIAKIAGMSLCDTYNLQYGREYISVVPANLYGPGDNYDMDTGHVIASLIKRMDDAKRCGSFDLSIWGSGAATRDFLYVEDLVRGCLLLMEKNYKGPMINIGSGVAVSIRELAHTIKKVVGFEGSLIFDLEKPEGMLEKLLDTTRINELGWHPKVSLEEGINISYLSDFKV
jgi:GDP-L-fucose synthase